MWAVDVVIDRFLKMIATLSFGRLKARGIEEAVAVQKEAIATLREGMEDALEALNQAEERWGSDPAKNEVVATFRVGVMLTMDTVKAVLEDASFSKQQSKELWPIPFGSSASSEPNLKDEASPGAAGSPPQTYPATPKKGPGRPRKHPLPIQPATQASPSTPGANGQAQRDSPTE
jgi:hypothetical protein